MRPIVSAAIWFGYIVFGRWWWWCCGSSPKIMDGCTGTCQAHVDAIYGGMNGHRSCTYICSVGFAKRKPSDHQKGKIGKCLALR
ncbi:hypothetical protein IWX92DRAFT_374554 [Phyllosticta citricarpa]